MGDKTLALRFLLLLIFIYYKCLITLQGTFCFVQNSEVAGMRGGEAIRRKRTLVKKLLGNHGVASGNASATLITVTNHWLSLT